MSQGSGTKLAEMEYRVIKPIGTGAGSTILLIEDTKLGQKYALKVVNRLSAEDDIYTAQALHEFEVLQGLNHPNIVKVHDCLTKRKWLKVSGVELLMEYIDGRNLDECACKSVGQLVLVFNKVASALVHMHRRRVYHADLKPLNIMVSRAGEIKVIDFGTAWIKGMDKQRIQGTPQYMAPEQVREKVVDERTDLYNFGATMYRMLTGKYANPDLPLGDVGGVALGGISGSSLVAPPMDLNPEIPGTLNETILACLQPNPEKRPAGVFEVKDQIKAVMRYLKLKKADIKGSDDPCD